MQESVTCEINASIEDKKWFLLLPFVVRHSMTPMLHIMVLISMMVTICFRVLENDPPEIGRDI